MSKKKSKLQQLKQSLKNLSRAKKVALGVGLAILAVGAVEVTRLSLRASSNISEGCYSTDSIPAVVMGRDENKLLIALIPTPMGFFVPIVVDEGKFNAVNPKRISCIEVFKTPNAQE
jgi:hypothetical protein